MRARHTPTPPVPTASTGTASAAASWRRWAAPPTDRSELGQTIGQATQCLRRLAWWQENEIVDVAAEPLALLQPRRQVGQVRGLLHLFGREAVDRLEPPGAHVVAAIAQIAEIGLSADQSARRQTFVDLDQQARPAAPEPL